MSIRYQWSGWRSSYEGNRITGWWCATINSRYFACTVSDPQTSAFEYRKGDNFDVRNSLTLEDYMERTSAFLIGPPCDRDFDEAFRPEKDRARDQLEVFMSVAWMQPEPTQFKFKDPIGGAYDRYASNFDVSSRRVVSRTLTGFDLGMTTPPKSTVVGAMEKKIQDVCAQLNTEVIKQVFEPSPFLTRLKDLAKK